ncbi:predicted protein [Chaetoceros tenuissimus]|uniref:Uncharacterized protein n=1 Tax=Chaetoceros tenuissimus TaxID=426638 RepID=A0AAD3CKC5_9STRA|nr:predicted protein [Chaetoceros tenuissimus]
MESLLCENLWVHITSFLTHVDPSFSSSTSSIIEKEERALKCTSKTIHQLLTSEEFYQAKTIELFASRSCIQDWPTLENVGSWKSLCHVLGLYIPLQGLYTLCESWPWGMLMDCKLQNGKVCGDLIRAIPETTMNTNSSRSACSYSVERVRLFEIQFQIDTFSKLQMKCVVYTGDGSIRHAVDFGIIKDDEVEGPETLTTMNPYPRNQSFLFHLQWPVGDNDEDEEEFGRVPFINDDTFHRRHDNDPNLFLKLIETLRTKSLVAPLEDLHRIRFELLDQNMKTSESVKEIEMFKSGFYVGNYGEMYGQFQHEIINVSYLDASDVDCLEKVFGSRLSIEVLQRVFDYRLPIQERLQTKIVVGRKLTGDLHVAAGEITWFADVSKPSSDGDAPVQVVDKDGVTYRVSKSWPGMGTLAYPLFQSSSWNDGWLLQLGNNHFAFCWDKFRDQDVTILHRISFS